MPRSSQARASIQVTVGGAVAMIEGLAAPSHSTPRSASGEVSRTALARTFRTLLASARALCEQFPSAFAALVPVRANHKTAWRFCFSLHFGAKFVETSRSVSTGNRTKHFESEKCRLGHSQPPASLTLSIEGQTRGRVGWGPGQLALASTRSSSGLVARSITGCRCLGLDSADEYNAVRSLP